MKKLPADHKFAIEIRNKAWLDTVFADLLREHKVALVLQDLASMPRPWELNGKFDFVTADFVYVRWLGDRKGIEEQTKIWDKTVVDRRGDLVKWVELFRQLVSRDRNNAGAIQFPSRIAEAPVAHWLRTPSGDRQLPEMIDSFKRIVREIELVGA